MDPVTLRLLPTATLPLSEVFGPTWQGEGPHLGLRCGFVRLGLCNLTCEWCDTPYTWDRSRYDVKAECPDTPVLDIADAVHSLGVGTMVLSGGEPLMHQRTPALRLLLDSTAVDWHVETNGTLAPQPWLIDRVQHFTVSPKIGTRDPERKRIKPAALAAFPEHTAWKFVCTEQGDVDVVHRLCTDLGIAPSQVWIMPEGRTTAALLATQRDLAPRIRHHGYNLTTRLHVLLYGDERGV